MSNERPLPVAQTGIESFRNSTERLLGASATFVGVEEQVGHPQVGVFSFSDVSGTMYFDWSVDGANWHAFPTAGYKCGASIPEFHTAVKLGRYFRVRYVNDSTAQATFRLTTYFGSGFLPISSPLNQSLSLDNDATAVRPNDFYDEVARGLRSGVTKWNKFGYNSDIDAADGEVVIWDSTTNTFTPLESAETFDIAYDGTGGGSTDGAGTNGATALTIYYIDSDGKEAVGQHTLGTDGSDTTSFSGFGINRVAVSGTGTGDVNASDIVITATTAGTIQAVVPAGQGVTQQLIFHVASNRQANARWLWLNINKTSGGNPIVLLKAWVYNRTVDSKFEVFRVSIDTAVENTVPISDPIGFTLNANDVLWLTADTDRDNTVVSGRFSLVSYEI